MNEDPHSIVVQAFRVTALRDWKEVVECARDHSEQQSGDLRLLIGAHMADRVP